jgi:chemotaxis protein methyltransferase CheR
LLKELLPDLASWQLLILGTDINRNSLALAQQASYSEWSFREDQAKTAQPGYFSFDPATRQHCLNEEIQEMVHFAPLNLARDEFPAIYNNTTNMDLILCRNVTIYFNQETTQQVVNRFYEGLVEEGWLVVGHAEPSQEIYRAFQVHLFPGTLVYQKKRLNQSWPVSANNLEQNGEGSAYPFELNFGTKPGPAREESAVPFPPPAPAKESPLESPTGFPYDPEAAARQLLNEGRIEAAIALLRQQAQVTPEAAGLYGLLCRAYANLGAWEEALHWGQHALKLDNLLGEVYYTLGLVYEHQQQFELAIAMLKKVIYLEWETPLPYLHLATLYQKLGRLEEAQQAWRKVVALLSKWPPEKVVPDSGGETAQNLLRTVQRLLEKPK